MSIIYKPLKLKLLIIQSKLRPNKIFPNNNLMISKLSVMLKIKESLFKTLLNPPTICNLHLLKINQLKIFKSPFKIRHHPLRIRLLLNKTKPLFRTKLLLNKTKPPLFKTKLFLNKIWPLFKTKLNKIWLPLFKTKLLLNKIRQSLLNKN
jgi:hypothetical protein